jgi:hypothetical protein
VLIRNVLYHGTQKLASQKSTIQTPVAPFQYSLNSAGLSSKRFIPVYLRFDLSSCLFPWNSHIRYQFHISLFINEDKKYTNAHNSYKASPIQTLSFPVWFSFCLKSVKEIFLAISRNLSKRFVAFQQYRLVSLENTKLKKVSVNHKTDNGVFRNTIHRLYHSVHYFQNVIRFHSTRVNATQYHLRSEGK